MNRRLRLLLVLGLLVLLAVSLAGCNRERPPTTNDKGTPAPGRGTVAAPVGSATLPPTETGARAPQPTPAAPSSEPEQSSPAPAPTTSAPASGEDFNYTVVAGDNLAAIAARFGTTVNAIARLNSLANPNSLTLGQVLKIPGSDSQATGSTTSPSAPGTGSDTYTVQAGDTLGRIAQRFGTTADALASANGITNPDSIKVGQVLKLPGASSAAPETSDEPASGEETETADGNSHVVAQGETLSTIAKRYGVTVQQILTANNITNPDRIYVGQKLIIP